MLSLEISTAGYGAPAYVAGSLRQPAQQLRAHKPSSCWGIADASHAGRQSPQFPGYLWMSWQDGHPSWHYHAPGWQRGGTTSRRLAAV